MSKHTCEPALDISSVTVRVPVETKYKLVRLFAGKLSPAQAIAKICAQMTQDVHRSDKELAAVQAEMRAAYDKRMANRAKVAAYNASMRTLAKR